ncbi:MAG: DAK2 domain-containing protein [Clostridiales bacterium]|jgi:DAK2 domain fusion protein YloV|nr:DAK2 domain-containing protein [Clostridiales bacterium]
MYKTINGATFRKMILNGAKLLDINKEHVDSLNVFPVPDGDTGTNMSLTMFSAAKEVTNCPSNQMSDLCGAVSKGALRGARGNSGVILSQILRGMTDVLSSVTEFGAKDFARALKKGTEVAYKAVTKPKEGTILTVVRSLAESAEKYSKKNIEMTEFIQKIIEDGEETLKRTPEMLPVLMKAGVVDAGGRGLLIVFQGFHHVLIGSEDVSLAFDDNVSIDEDKYSEKSHFDYNDLAEIEFAYCTEFFVINLHKKTTEADIDRLRESLMSIGDCVLVIGDLSMVKVHVHTNEPGVALTYALELGELDKLKIENMLEQNRALTGQKREDLKPFGIVSICAGEGLTNIFKDLLVDKVIEGGQTMNPSADDIAKACDAVGAKDIFVLPNNKNIILAAEQAKALSKRKLHIIPTRNVPQGLSAVLAFNPEDSAAGNETGMNEAIRHIKAGLVTYAVRSTTVDEFELKEGDIIAMDQNAIVAKGDSVGDVTKQLVAGMMDDEISNVTLYFGNNVTEDEAQAIADSLAADYKRCDIDIHFGGQPLYYYIVSLE